MSSLSLNPVTVPRKKAALEIVQNSGKIYRFVPGKNRLTNETGWRPIDLRGFDPVPPIMVVHDILEHFPGDEFDPHNEYQAQGAMFWLRHEGGYFRKLGFGEAEEAVIAPAFGMLFKHIAGKKLKTKKCPAVLEASEPLDTNDTDRRMQKAVFNAYDYINGQYIGGYFRLPPEVTNADKAKARLHESLKSALGWMRIGYRRAAMRYRGVDKQKLVNLYINIQNKMGGIKAEGRVVVSLSINPRSYSAKLSVEDAIGHTVARR